jgi:hypothetical protein
MQLSSVDLPQPEGPSSTRNSPFGDVEIQRLSTLHGTEIERQILDGDACCS